MRQTSQLLSLLALAVLCSTPAMALTTPNEPWNPALATDELNLYEIYNSLYGTVLTSNAELDAFQVDMETFTLGLADQVRVDARARFAGSTQRFGWYDATAPVASPDNLLYHVTDYGLLAGGEYSALISPPGEFGFFLNPVGGRAGGNLWFSEDAENGGQEHFLVYTTPLANTYFLAWEDLNLIRSDEDYQDLVLELFLAPVIPEPTSLLLLGIGIAGMLVARLRFHSA